MKLTEFELKNTYGGTDLFRSSFINSFVKMYTIVLEIGKSFGSAINRIKNNNYCP